VPGALRGTREGGNRCGGWQREHLDNVGYILKGTAALSSSFTTSLILIMVTTSNPAVEQLSHEPAISSIGSILDLIDRDPVVLKLLQHPEPAHAIGRHACGLFQQLRLPADCWRQCSRDT
jgi:hypothetical protein